MTTAIPKSGTNQEDGPEGRAEDAVRPLAGGGKPSSIP